MNFNDFLAVMNPMMDYFKELNSLKDAGIDLTKLAAHKVLYQMYLAELFNKIGVEKTTQMVNFANTPVGDLHTLYDTLFDQQEVDDPVVAARNPEHKPRTTEMYFADGKKIDKETYDQMYAEFSKMFDEMFGKWMR